MYYLDTSAFVKLFLSEDHSAAARRWFRGHREVSFSSDLLRTESLRVARRVSPAATRTARDLLDLVPSITLDVGVCERAAMLDPAILRSLDALHLASAMSYEDELEGMVTYDDRLGEAAVAYGIAVVAPR